MDITLRKITGCFCCLKIVLNNSLSLKLVTFIARYRSIKSDIYSENEQCKCSVFFWRCFLGDLFFFFLLLVCCLFVLLFQTPFVHVFLNTFFRKQDKERQIFISITHNTDKRVHRKILFIATNCFQCSSSPRYLHNFFSKLTKKRKSSCFFKINFKQKKNTFHFLSRTLNYWDKKQGEIHYV